MTNDEFRMINFEPNMIIFSTKINLKTVKTNQGLILCTLSYELTRLGMGFEGEMGGII